MRTIKIDDKWTVKTIDPWSDKAEPHVEPEITRHGFNNGFILGNLGLAMAWRIMALENVVIDLVDGEKEGNLESGTGLPYERCAEIRAMFDKIMEDVT